MFEKRVTNLSCKMTSESVLVNGRCVPGVCVSPPSTSTTQKTAYTTTSEASGESVEVLPADEMMAKEVEDPPVVEIERGLNELSLTGTAINRLVVELTRTKEQYRQVMMEGRASVDDLMTKLRSHIVKSAPYVDLYRKAQKVQGMSNKAAARYDKANSQHAAAKEMIRVAESQLASCREEQLASNDPSSPSPLDAAWQEMLNHATGKVVVTEKERRDSEIEHRKVLEDCTKAMKQFQLVKRKLHSHIVKAKPYYDERFKVNQQLIKVKAKIKELEKKISESKQKYAASLKHLDLLSTDMHIRRGNMDGMHLGKSDLDSRKTVSTGNTPEMRRNARSNLDNFDLPCMMDNVSVESFQMSDSGVQFGGSTSSLPSLDTEHSPSSEDQNNKFKLKHSSSFSSSSSSPSSSTSVPSTHSASVNSMNQQSNAEIYSSEVDQVSSSCNEDNIPAALEEVAGELVVRCVSDAVSQVELTSEGSMTSSGNIPAALEEVASELVVRCVNDAVSQVELTSESSEYGHLATIC